MGLPVIGSTGAAAVVRRRVGAVSTDAVVPVSSVHAATAGVDDPEHCEARDRRDGRATRRRSPPDHRTDPIAT